MEEKMPHSLKLSERRELTMTGVTEVLSFDEGAVALRTTLGTLVVQGKELRLRTLSLDGGQVAVSGTVASLVYEEPRPAGLWARLSR